MLSVKKRDGRIVPFNREKVYSAVYKCTKNEKISEDVSDIVCKALKGEDVVSVNSIQNIVEDTLMKKGYFDFAKSYICYRYLHDVAREKYNKLTKTIEKKLYASDVQNQNANIDEKSFGGRKGEVTDAVLKRYALDNCMSKKSRNNHESNEIYIHDLNSYAIGSSNCLSIPFDKLLRDGFNTRQTSVRPAKSVSTAAQLIAVILQIQSLSLFGGVSATHLDWTLVPYVRMSFYKHYIDGMEFVETKKFTHKFNKDISIQDKYYKKNEHAHNYAIHMLKKEIYQAMEGMFHNLNTLQSRSGNQLD